MTDLPDPARALRPLSRRQVLRWTLWGAAATVAAGTGTLALLRRSPVDSQALPGYLLHLVAAEYHLFARAIEVLLPVAGTPFPPPSGLPVIANIDRMVGLLEPGVRRDLGAGLVLFDHGPLVSGWHGRRFVDLPTAQAAAYFDRWAAGSSLQRALATTVKKFVYAAYWREPATWPALQFDGPVSERWGLPSLGNAPLPDADRSPA